MADEYANVTLAHKIHSDRRFDLMAEIAGWSRWEAVGRMSALFARCTALQTDRPSSEVIRVHLGLRGELLLVESTLGERCPDGGIRVKGGGLTGGDTDRFGWYEPVREQQREAGSKRARTAVRGPGGRFGEGSARSSAGPALTSGSTAAGPAVSSGSPAVTSAHPASGFRIPDQRSESLPLARDPAVPDPGPRLEIPYNPDDPRARGRLAEATYRIVSDARVELAAELKLPAPLPFPPITPGSTTRGFSELAARIREEGALAPAACDRVVANLIAQARTKRSIDWLAERAFGDKAWNNARDGVDPSVRAGPQECPARAPEQPRKIPTLA